MKSNTPALAALRDHQQRLGTLIAESAGLEHRIAGFSDTATAVQPSQHRLEALQAQRRQVLAAVALSEAHTDDLDRIDSELLDAQAQARAGARAAEIAEAGAAHLQGQHAALAARITAESERGPTLCHAAAMETVRARLRPYAEALRALSEAHVALTGACMAADRYVDLYAIPARSYITGRLPMAGMGLVLPELLDLHADDFAIEPNPRAFADATAAVLAELEGTN